MILERPVRGENEPITIRLPDENFEELKKEALKRGLSTNGLINNLIADFLKSLKE